MRNFIISYGLSDGQGPFQDDIKADDIQQALYQFARKHPNVDPANINSVARRPADYQGHPKKDPLNQAKKPSFVKWRMDKNNNPGHCSPHIHEVIDWIEEILL